MNSLLKIYENVIAKENSNADANWLTDIPKSMAKLLISTKVAKQNEHIPTIWNLYKNIQLDKYYPFYGYIADSETGEAPAKNYVDLNTINYIGFYQADIVLKGQYIAIVAQLDVRLNMDELNIYKQAPETLSVIRALFNIKIMEAHRIIGSLSNSHKMKLDI